MKLGDLLESGLSTWILFLMDRWIDRQTGVCTWMQGWVCILTSPNSLPGGLGAMRPWQPPHTLCWDLWDGAQCWAAFRRPPEQLKNILHMTSVGTQPARPEGKTSRLDLLSKPLTSPGVPPAEKEIKEALILNKFSLIIDGFITPPIDWFTGTLRPCPLSWWLWQTPLGIPGFYFCPAMPQAKWETNFVWKLICKVVHISGRSSFCPRTSWPQNVISEFRNMSRSQSNVFW